MTQDTPEPADREQSPDANQDARVSGYGRAYQAIKLAATRLLPSFTITADQILTFLGSLL